MKAASRLLFAIVCLLAIVSSPVAAQTIKMSPEEAVWIAEHKKSIRVGITAFPPLAVMDEATGAWTGLAVDVLRLYEERLGVSFELVPIASWHELIAAAQARTVDMMAFGVRSPERETYLHFASPYSVLHNRIIVRRGERNIGKITLDDLRGKRVAVLESSIVHELLKRQQPQLILYPVREERGVVAAVAYHEADAAIVETSRANWMIESEGMTSIAIGGTTPYDYPESVSVRNDWPIMMRLLDRASLSIGSDLFSRLSSKWVREGGAGIWGDPRTRLIAAAVGLALVIALLLILVWNRALRRTVAVRTELLREQVRTIEYAQAELRRSEEKFRGLAELTSDWFWEQDADGRFTRFYGGGLDKVQLDETQFIGRARWERPIPIRGLSDAEMDAHRHLVEAHQPFRNLIYQLENRHGQLRWVTISGQPVHAADGRFLGYRGTGQDITERMEDQIARTESLERLRALLDGTFSFAGLLDPEGVLIDCNRTSLRFIDATKADVIGKLLWDTPWFSLPEEATRVRGAIAAARRGEFVRYDSRHRDAAGALHWVDFSLSPIFDERQQVIYLVPEGRDITDAKRASEALGSLVSSTSSVFGEAYFRSLVESLARILAVRYVFVGRLATGAHRIRTEALWADGQIVDNIEYELEHTPCDNVMGSGCCVFPRDVCLSYPQDAMLREMGIESYMGVPVTGSSGKPIGVVVAMHDQPLVDSASARQLMELFALRVSTEFERLDFESAIRDLNAGLEQRVAERTLQLTQANYELEAFSYSVSHDLRAPLRHISGFVEMLQEHAGDRLDDEGQRLLRVIAGSAERMGVLIDSLLAFSRVSRIDLHKSPIDCTKLVEEVIFELEADTRGRALEWKIGALPEVMADRSLLRQVWTNLLANALKYTRGRDPASIEVGAVDVDGELCLFVRDNGVGFNMKYLDKLFGVFQRLHRAEEFEGSGIGLANVKRIVERHGGRVWAEGREGAGATFWFTLQKADGAAHAAAAT